MTLALATTADVEDRLGRTLTVTDAHTSGLIEEASALITGWLGETPDPIPDAARITTARVVARALTATATAADPGTASTSMTAGPFALTRSYTPEATSGSVWLSQQDKVMLRPYRRRPRAGRFNTA